MLPVSRHIAAGLTGPDGFWDVPIDCHAPTMQYVAHSGWGNQVHAFQNAILIAAILNRVPNTCTSGPASAETHRDKLRQLQRKDTIAEKAPTKGQRAF